ncbi:4-hydroxybenzoate 3-monooxygenase [Nonomuraea sp. SMC257]|uniref:4-hydroxybenzoate 3-monooxygenase n=1 Tax=Nonomuraea montanisoli TaxID=2741721 RepID=A0A7Y6M7B0_9ACTN|nr:4-hydroxybenzoate 3-monooxygenase [Nonomuraea montanisoli]NUW36169.1 4-hydroxybenzoate 3-monooxygenase [Nonomuraea montanisoli]
MVETAENTTVVIVGAGVAGLTLGNFLLRSGIGCVVVEKHRRSYVEKRQRAGAVDSRGVRMFREWGLEDVVKDGVPLKEVIGGTWIDGVMYPLGFEDEDTDTVLCPQQVLVRNLTDTFLQAGGDLRFEALDVSLEDLDSERPTVRYRTPDGSAATVTCDFVAGCDGFHGVSRASVPAGALTLYSHEYEYSWLSVLAEVPTSPFGMAIHDRGLAARFPRGADASRLYLQCPAGDTPEQWPDERVWNEVRARFCADVPTGRIVDKRIVPLRCVVFSPMSHGRLYLLGDAAHIVPPMSAKGIHLALHDTEVFARAIIAKVREGEASLLDGYSDTCLSHVWNYQAYAIWITDLMHDAGDASYEGAFRKEIARAELRRLNDSPAAGRLYNALRAGLL